MFYIKQSRKWQEKFVTIPILMILLWGLCVCVCPLSWFLFCLFVCLRLEIVIDNIPFYCRHGHEDKNGQHAHLDTRHIWLNFKRIRYGMSVTFHHSFFFLARLPCLVLFSGDDKQCLARGACVCTHIWVAINIKHTHTHIKRSSSIWCYTNIGYALRPHHIIYNLCSLGSSCTIVIFHRKISY